MSGNKLIYHHALKISADKWSCQISSRDRPIQTLNFQLQTLIPVVAKFICSQKAKAHKISASLLWCLEYHGSLNCETPADEELCWDGLLQRYLSGSAERITAGCPAAGFALEEYLRPVVWHFIFPFAHSSWLLIWSGAQDQGAGRESFSSLYH